MIIAVIVISSYTSGVSCFGDKFTGWYRIPSDYYLKEQLNLDYTLRNKKLIGYF